jgi:hypothetical protein
MQNFTDVCVRAKPDVLSAHELFETRGQTDSCVVFIENFIVVGVFFAAKIMNLSLVVAWPFWKLG